jgi:hypothetical protein
VDRWMEPVQRAKARIRNWKPETRNASQKEMAARKPAPNKRSGWCKVYCGDETMQEATMVISRESSMRQ